MNEPTKGFGAFLAALHLFPEQTTGCVLLSWLGHQRGAGADMAKAEATLADKTYFPTLHIVDGEIYFAVGPTASPSVYRVGVQEPPPPSLTFALLESEQIPQWLPERLTRARAEAQAQAERKIAEAAAFVFAQPGAGQA